MTKTMTKVARKQMKSFRLRRDVVEMLSIISKELGQTRTSIVEGLVEILFFKLKKNRTRLL